MITSKLLLPRIRNDLRKSRSDKRYVYNWRRHIVCILDVLIGLETIDRHNWQRNYIWRVVDGDPNEGRLHTSVIIAFDSDVDIEGVDGISILSSPLTPCRIL